MLLTMELYPYARRSGLGTAFFERGERRFRWQLTLGFVFTLVVSVALAGAMGIALLAAACAVAWAIGAWATRLLGGVTGDIYGAVNEVVEVSGTAACADADCSSAVRHTLATAGYAVVQFAMNWLAWHP